MKHRIAHLLVAATLAVAAPLFAHATEPADMTDGEVRKVDAVNGKLTIKHGEIKHLDMPAMTMVFVVKDKVALDKLKAGDKVRFKAVKEGSTFAATEIEPTR